LKKTFRFLHLRNFFERPGRHRIYRVGIKHFIFLKMVQTISNTYYDLKKKKRKKCVVWGWCICEVVFVVFFKFSKNSKFEKWVQGIIFAINNKVTNCQREYFKPHNLFWENSNLKRTEQILLFNLSFSKTAFFVVSGIYLNIKIFQRTI
jgi:hypothetical protein